MIKIGFIEFPPEAAERVADCYSTLGNPPEHVCIRDTYVFNEDNKPIRAFSIFEYDDAHEALAETFLKKRYEAFSAIPGLTYSVEHWLKVDDALEILGSGDFGSQLTSSGQGF